MSDVFILEAYITIFSFVNTSSGHSQCSLSAVTCCVIFLFLLRNMFGYVLPSSSYSPSHVALVNIPTHSLFSLIYCQLFLAHIFPHIKMPSYLAWTFLIFIYPFFPSNVSAASSYLFVFLFSCITNHCCHFLMRLTSSVCGLVWLKFSSLYFLVLEVYLLSDQKILNFIWI